MSNDTREKLATELRRRIEALELQSFWDEVILDECGRDPSAIAKLAGTTQRDLREAESELSRLTAHQ